LLSFVSLFVFPLDNIYFVFDNTLCIRVQDSLKNNLYKVLFSLSLVLFAFVKQRLAFSR
jgi:hypothetical protein